MIDYTVKNEVSNNQILFNNYSIHHEISQFCGHSRDREKTLINDNIVSPTKHSDKDEENQGSTVTVCRKR